MALRKRKIKANATDVKDGRMANDGQKKPGSDGANLTKDDPIVDRKGDKPMMATVTVL